MRPIDADKLRAYFVDLAKDRDYGFGDVGKMLSIKIEHIVDTIDNAPTIEPTEEFEWCTDCKEYDQEKHCCHRWSKQIRKTVAELEEHYKPKRGEWIEFDTKWGRSFYYCTNCMETSEVPTAFGKPLYDFCPNCGADMRQTENEDEKL